MRLTLVPTPIGNLGDITLRAIDTLRAVEVVAAEDTRRSAALLHHLGIAKRLVRLDAHRLRERGLTPLMPFEHAAFVTDAGTPGISDPGIELVRLALALGVTLEVLPGPTALLPALVLSGLPAARFAFEGFLPRKGRARRDRLQEVVRRTITTVIYESPRRLATTLEELRELCGGARRASVSRELTKRFETTCRGTLDELLTTFRNQEARGEVVLVLAPAEPPVEGIVPAVLKRKAEELQARGLHGRSLREALEELGATRNQAYEVLLELERF